MKNKSETEVEILGTKKKGYFIYITDNKHLFMNTPVTEDELRQLQVLLNKRFGNEEQVEKIFKK